MACDPKYDGYQKGLASMVYMFFYKRSSRNGIDAEPNYSLQMSFICRLLKHSRDEKFINCIWVVDLADMQSLSKYNKKIKYLLCAIDLFSIYVWVVPLKDKRGISNVNEFQKIVSKGRKKKIWVDQGGEFYNNFLKKFLKVNNIEMY